MDTLVLGLLLLVLSAQGAVWYKLGKVEAEIKNHLYHAHRED
ncbi:MAG: hypothetical protein ACE5IA_02360 [Dehalococcoidia bacterium]